MNVRGGVAVVTGASSGIGWHTALDLAGAGATVVAVARREERLRTLLGELERRGTPARMAVCDVADRGAVDAAAAQVLDELGRIDILVNNAGIPLHRAFLDCSVEDIERVTAVNYLGTIYWMKAVLPAMRARRRGSIINVASMAGAVPWTFEAAYSASKAAVIALTEAVGPELRRYGIHCGWINPGLVRTEIFTDDFWKHIPPGVERTMLEPGVLSAAIVDAIERERPGVTVPRRMAAPALLRHLAPRPFRMGMRKTYEAALRRAGE